MDFVTPITNKLQFKEKVMGRKIFVSYKYKDSDVKPLEDTKTIAWKSLQNPITGFYQSEPEDTTVRTYVDKLEDYFSAKDVYKGESDDEDLSNLSESTIWEKLKGKIFDSSVTLVLISPNMKKPYRQEKLQWIPWEISYSLKETTRNDRTSHSNAILAVALPNKNGSYSYSFDEADNTIKTENLFKILGSNMFNRKDGLKSGEHSYIKTVKWSDFITNPHGYIEKAVEIKENINDYNITKEV
ncbi:MAG: hypothetical protein Ta2B_10940 [Termitinemataceae bacterium]|nr:MAG: hypothetical protein Ta2B_10940 [Termitinemataceae bacterium]